MAAFSKQQVDDEDRFNAYSSLSLQQTDEARRIAGSAGPPLHVEDELDAFGREQLPLWAAEGTVAGREAFVERERLSGQRQSATDLAMGDMELVEQARRRLRVTTSALGPFVRRKGGQKGWFIARTALLLLGDVAGQAGAQIYFGEIPELALVQSLAAGVAVVTAGLVGGEVKDLRMAAKRQTPAEQLSKAQSRLPHMFRGVDEGHRFVRCLVYTAGVVGSLISVGIFALRAFVDSPLAGLIYGAIAAGVAAASFVSSYVYADEAADAIDNAEKAYGKAVERQLKLAGHPVAQRADAASASHHSTVEEYTLRGTAASIAHEGLKHRVLRRNPGVAGHGPAQEPEPIIGSRPRLNDGVA